LLPGFQTGDACGKEVRIMDEHTEQRIESLDLKVDALTLQVEKLARLVYKLFKRLPREKVSAARPDETA
jgi:hypothetical protein